MDASTIVTLAQIASSTLITMCAIIFGKNKNFNSKRNTTDAENDSNTKIKRIMIRGGYEDENNADKQ